MAGEAGRSVWQAGECLMHVEWRMRLATGCCPCPHPRCNWLTATRSNQDSDLATTVSPTWRNPRRSGRPMASVAMTLLLTSWTCRRTAAHVRQAVSSHRGASSTTSTWADESAPVAGYPAAPGQLRPPPSTSNVYVPPIPQQVTQQ